VKTYILKQETIIHQPLETVFQFFSTAENLNRLTPPHLKFEILTPLPITMAKGTLIDYQLKIYYFPVKWKTEIIVWEPPYRFIDSQLKGPYRKWIHEHKFEAVGEKTKMTDTLEYAIPGGIFSAIINNLFVKKDIQNIFNFREEQLLTIFGRYDKPE
jgi:ligand-binding SRPBCC domain-containing protein